MSLVNIATKKVWKCLEAARNEPTTDRSVSPWRPAVACPSCSPTPTGVFGGAIRFYAPLCTVVKWVPHFQVACGDRPIWAHLLLIRRTDPLRPPPPHPAPPPTNITRVKVRAGRWDPQSSAAKLWRLQSEQMSTDGGPAAADYQVGNNSGCFDSKVAFWELLVLGRLF